MYPQLLSTIRLVKEREWVDWNKVCTLQVSNRIYWKRLWAVGVTQGRLKIGKWGWWRTGLGLWRTYLIWRPQPQPVLWWCHACIWGYRCVLFPLSSLGSLGGGLELAHLLYLASGQMCLGRAVGVKCYTIFSFLNIRCDYSDAMCKCVKVVWLLRN